MIKNNVFDLSLYRELKKSGFTIIWNKDKTKINLIVKIGKDINDIKEETKKL